jgi:hypothetical protein
MCEGVRVDPGKPGAGSLHTPHRAMRLAVGPELRDDGENLVTFSPADRVTAS